MANYSITACKDRWPCGPRNPTVYANDHVRQAIFLGGFVCWMPGRYEGDVETRGEFLDGSVNFREAHFMMDGGGRLW